MVGLHCLHTEWTKVSPAIGARLSLLLNKHAYICLCNLVPPISWRSPWLKLGIAKVYLGGIAQSWKLQQAADGCVAEEV